MAENAELKHCFKDVTVFRDGEGWCYVKNRKIPIDRTTCDIDLLISGPSCKNLSLLNNERKNYVGSYDVPEEESEGTSGPTYFFGFKRVTK